MKKEILPVSGSVSKCVRLLLICLQSAINREQRVGICDDFLGNNVPFSWLNSRSGVNGCTNSKARKDTGLHHGTATPNKNIAFQVQHHVLAI